MNVQTYFGAVLVPSKPDNHRRGATLQLEKEDFGDGTLALPSVTSLLKEIAGDKNVETGRGEWYSGVRERGELLISQTVPDEFMKANLTRAGFKDVRTIPDEELGKKQTVAQIGTNQYPD